MKKSVPIGIVISAIVILIILYLSVWGIQTLSTDKKVYSQGEKVSINMLDFFMYWCTGGNELHIFKQVGGEWNEIQYDLPSGFGNPVCVNGIIIHLAYSEGSFLFPNADFWKDTYSWDSKIFEEKGVVDSCNISGMDIQVNRTMRSYELKNAPPGKYTFKYGMAEKIISIK